MSTDRAEQFRALFDPRGVVVAGASTHPGKFGFVALHNILAHGYTGRVFATNREATPVLGIDTVPSLSDIPDGEADLVFVCTPAATNPDVLRDAAAKGIRAAFLASAGYSEAGDEGRRAQDELVALADDLGVLIVGPNGQGVISTPSSLCAQIVAPYPPAGRIGVASQSGNFVSSFLNYACASGVGISRAVSAGNSAMVGVTDFLGFYADDPHTDVALVYVEGISDGRRFFDELRAVSARMPVVLVKGGATQGGARAAASHTGSLATDDRVFDGMCRQAGVIRASTIEEAYELAATFATQPEPRGNRVAVVSTAGGWGVVTADAIASTGLDLTALPDDLVAALDAELPRDGAATTRSTWPAGRRRTRSRTSSRSSPAIPPSTGWYCSGWASSRTRGEWSAKARSSRTTASIASPPSTTVRITGTRRRPPRSWPSWTNPSWSRRSWR